MPKSDGNLCQSLGFQIVSIHNSNMINARPPHPPYFTQFQYEMKLLADPDSTISFILVDPCGNLCFLFSLKSDCILSAITGSKAYTHILQQEDMCKSLGGSNNKKNLCGGDKVNERSRPVSKT